jgi:hypothetical protein
MVNKQSTWPSHTPWTAEVMTHGKDAGMYQVVNSKGWVIAECMVQEEAQNVAALPELMNALDDLLKHTVDRDLAEGIALTAGAKNARRKALAALKKANAGGP